MSSIPLRLSFIYTVYMRQGVTEKKIKEKNYSFRNIYMLFKAFLQRKNGPFLRCTTMLEWSAYEIFRNPIKALNAYMLGIILLGIFPPRVESRPESQVHWCAWGVLQCQGNCLRSTIQKLHIPGVDQQEMLNTWPMGQEKTTTAFHEGFDSAAACQVCSCNATRLIPPRDSEELNSWILIEFRQEINAKGSDQGSFGLRQNKTPGCMKRD